MKHLIKASIDCIVFSGETVIFGICLPLAAGATQVELRKIFRLDNGVPQIAEASSLDEVICWFYSGSLHTRFFQSLLPRLLRFLHFKLRRE